MKQRARALDSSSKHFLLSSPSLINEEYMKNTPEIRRICVKVEPSKPTETRQYSTSSGRDCNPTRPLKPPSPTTRRAPGYLPPIGGAKQPTKHPDCRESSDAYCRVIAGDDKHRIIVCRHGIQFIIQRVAGRGTSITGREWRGISYHRERASLIRRVEEICGRTLDEIFDGGGSEIAKLPEIC